MSCPKAKGAMWRQEKSMVYDYYIINSPSSSLQDGLNNRLLLIDIDGTLLCPRVAPKTILLISIPS